MRQELTKIYSTKKPGDGPIYTVLPSFAEVMYYVGDTDKVIVTSEGLIQFSGKSLLDSYVRSGEIVIADPPAKQSYWMVTPGIKSEFIKH
jgi:hypothetical protein